MLVNIIRTTKILINTAIITNNTIKTIAMPIIPYFI